MISRYKTSSKAFTLVELLAVIVILAIVAIIATPVIVGVIEKTKKGAAKDSASLYASAVEQQIIANELNTSINDIENGTYTVEELRNKYNVKVKGKAPSDNSLVTIINKSVKQGLLSVNGYSIEYYDGKTELVGKSNGNIVYKDLVLNGTDPVIKNNLIPVVISDDGTVKKADTSKEWYNYNNKRWANAVILKNESTVYNTNDEIPESNIESYFVWIPRYKYKIFNEGNYNTNDGITHTSIDTINSKAQTIEIVFESKDKTPTLGTKVGEYLTHPAFTTFNSNGMWVGKFETGYDGATTTAMAHVNSNDSLKIIVKPNVFSWRNNTVYNMFLSSYNYNRDLDSHMMKNTEWGAVAYLSHSKYGINKEVRINNNSARITGYSNVTIPTCGWTGTNEECNKYESTNLNQDGTYTKMYNTSIGYLASTTGNITGIYDMSGGAHEYMASYVSGQLGSSGFTTTTIANYNSKYFDVYNSNSVWNSFQYRILGDATGEMGPFTIFKSTGNSVEETANINSWYADGSAFVDSSYPWFNRGGGFDSGNLAGQFLFHKHTGYVANYLGSRLVLAP